MAKRAALVLLLLWCCWGAYRLATHGADDPAADLVEDPPTVEEVATDSSARLAARDPLPSGPDRSGDPAQRTLRPLPAWLASQLRFLDGADRARFVAWLRADPTRILDFVLAGTETRQVDPRSPLDFAHAASEALGSDARGLEFVVPVLTADLGVEGRTGGQLAALLGALDVFVPVAAARGHEPVAALVDDADLPAGVRPLAVLLCLQYPSLGAAEGARILATIQLADMRHRREFRMLLEGLKRRGAEAREFLPALLALHERTFRFRCGRGPVLEALIEMAPDDPRVLDAAARALGSDGSHRTMARAFLVEGGVERRQRLIDHLQRGSGSARVQGVTALLEVGVPVGEVGRLLVPALTDKSHHVRTQAVGLLARSGLQAHEVLPSIQELLGSKKEEKWLTATQALGAVSRMEGDRRPIVDLLFAAVRMPSAQVRITAVQALLMFDGENKRIIPLLVDLLDDSEVRVRCEALDGLGELSAHDATARRHVEAALGDSDERVRQIARYWLEEEGGDHDDD